MDAVAWILNLDAELELAIGSSYNPPQATLQQIRRAAQLAVDTGLVADADVVVWPEVPPGDATSRHCGSRRSPPLRGGGLVRAWSPTPRAQRLARAAGYQLPESPSVEVLREVNHRWFTHELKLGLTGHWVATLEELERVLRAAPGPWMAKRGLGFSGFGCRSLRTPRRGCSLTDDDAAWVRGALKATAAPPSGLLMEPRVNIIQEFSLHGQLLADGTLTLGRPCVQTVDGYRAFLSARPAEPGELSDTESGALVAAASRAAVALTAAGYFGPFGIDAYRYRESPPAGDAQPVLFNPFSELNARFTMSWAIGMRS